MFQFTPDEAQSTALAVIEHLRSEKHNVVVEEGVDPSVGFRPTMTGTLGVLKTYVEAQSTPLFSRGLRDLVSWASVQRTYSEIFIAAPTSADAGTAASIKGGPKLSQCASTRTATTPSSLIPRIAH